MEEHNPATTPLIQNTYVEELAIRHAQNVEKERQRSEKKRQKKEEEKKLKNREAKHLQSLELMTALLSKKFPGTFVIEELRNFSPSEFKNLLTEARRQQCWARRLLWAIPLIPGAIGIFVSSFFTSHVWMFIVLSILVLSGAIKILCVSRSLELKLKTGLSFSNDSSLLRDLERRFEEQLME